MFTKRRTWLTKLVFSAFVACFASSGILKANEQALPSTVPELRSYLDVINFEIKGDEKIALLEKLVKHTESLAKQDPNSAGITMMAGFFNAQYAAAKGGMGALKYAKAARDHLEVSSKLDPSLYGASALSVLGSLYYQVPGWPIGFGDKKKAVKHFERALEHAPDGIDANITYARYLFDEKKYQQAQKFYQKAKAAPARPDRPRADQELQKEITLRLQEINKKLG